MTKINYEDDGKNTTIEVEGTSHDLFRAICRIAASLKKETKLTKDSSTFEELLVKGIKTAEKEVELQELMKGDKSLRELFDMLEKLLND